MGSVPTCSLASTAMCSAQTGAHTVILLEGINDLGALSRDGLASPERRAETVARMLAAYGQIVERAHVRGIRVIGATMTPYMGSDYYHPFPENEADRRAVNQWIRISGTFDAIVDFDSVLADRRIRSACCRHTTPATICIHLLPGTRRWQMPFRSCC